MQKIDLLLRWNCKSSDALCVPHPSRRYTSWEVPWYIEVGTEGTRKKKKGMPKSAHVRCSYHHRYLPVVSVWPKGICTCTCTKRTKKKEEDCLSSSSPSSSIHLSTYSPTNQPQTQHLINVPPIFSFFFPFPPKIFYEQIMQTRNVRVIYILHKDPSFLCTQGAMSEVGESGSSCTCYLLGKRRVRSGQSGRPGGTGGGRRPDVMRNLLRKKKFGVVWFGWSGLVWSC